MDYRTYRVGLVIERYGLVARILHWTMAIGIITLLAFGGAWMGHAHSIMATVHASLGFSLLLLAVVRLAWRAFHPPPPPTVSEIQRRAAPALQWTMYAAMIAVPLAGWLAYTEHVRRTMGVRSASRFGVVRIPLLPDYGINFHFLHKWGGRAFMALIALHILAALKHHFVDRNDVLKRML